MSSLTRIELGDLIFDALVERMGAKDPGLMVGRDPDRILVFSPGGPYFAVKVEELLLTPKRTRKKGGRAQTN